MMLDVETATYLSLVKNLLYAFCVRVLLKDLLQISYYRISLKRSNRLLCHEQII